MDESTWETLLLPGPPEAVRSRLASWRQADPVGRLVADEDLRLDLIRTDAGDQLRVMLRVGPSGDARPPATLPEH